MANPHPTNFSGLFTLNAVANFNLETDIIPVVAPGMSGKILEMSWRVYSGGPVAKSSAPMAVITDGAQYSVGDGTPKEEHVNANRVNFFPTADTDKIELTLKGI